MKMGSGQKDDKDCLVGCVEKDPLVKLSMYSMVTKQCFATCLEAVSNRWLNYWLWFQKLVLLNLIKASFSCFLRCSVLASFIFSCGVLWYLWTQPFLILSFFKMFLRGKVALHFLFQNMLTEMCCNFSMEALPSNGHLQFLGNLQCLSNDSVKKVKAALHAYSR